MGFGISTRASIEYLQANEHGQYFLSDHQRLSKEDQRWLEFRGIAYEDGGHTQKVLQAKRILISPSVPPSHPIICQAIKCGIPVWTDLDLIADRISEKTRTVGITGTNGKTTTVEWLTHILNGASQAVSLGNIGESPARFFLENPSWEGPYMVFELSSYQLHYIHSFQVQIGVLLNITPDHLSWHGNLDAYRRDKLRILQCAKESMIVHHQDLFQDVKFQGDLYTISSTNQEASCVIDLNNLAYTIKTKTSTMRLSFKNVQLHGLHNIQNGAAACVSAALMDIPPAVIQEGLTSYAPSAHRLEVFHRVGQTLFINDSKATNVDATIRALETFGNGQKNIVLLMGGCAKGESYLPLREAARDHVRIALVCGENAPLLAEAFEGIIPYAQFESWQALIRQMRRWMHGDEVVLFSPGGSSFDFFQNYADRGEKIKSWIVDEFPHQ